MAKRSTKTSLMKTSSGAARFAVATHFSKSAVVDISLKSAANLAAGWRLMLAWPTGSPLEPDGDQRRIECPLGGNEPSVNSIANKACGRQKKPGQCERDLEQVVQTVKVVVR